MHFHNITPEQAGIPSSCVADYIAYLERVGCSMHSVLLMRDNQLFAELYWAPFHRDRLHRMYSQTKSYVSIAIGLLLEEGKLTLDDTIASHFPEKIQRDLPPYLANQTIRDMLKMTTCGRPDGWFGSPEHDRTRLYLNTNKADHPAGTRWCYDSPGSQVLASLVEKLSGMRLLDYLKRKLFDTMGTFTDARILRTKNGDSWGDSALLCTPRDMASCARLVMHYGEWDGVQLMSREYLMEATSNLADNCEDGFDGVFDQGYGYQIWRVKHNGFAFVGMGDQLTVMIPDKDLIFVCTADNQGFSAARQMIINGFFDYILANLGDSPLPADPCAEQKLADLAASRKLRAAAGETDSPIRNTIHGREFVCSPHHSGITRFRLDFTENGGVLHYTNGQGEKQLPFGMCENVFTKFPQYGYSGEYGGLSTDDGSLYDCAASAAWRVGNRLMLQVRIIDHYLANATFTFDFKGEECVLTMVKNAENFLGEYQGQLVARMQ